MVSFLFPLVSALHWGCGWEPFVWVKASWRCNRCGGQDRRSQKSTRWNTVVQLGSHAFISQSGPPWVHIARGSLSLCLQAPRLSHSFPPACQGCPGQGGKTFMVLIKTCCRGNQAY